MDHWIALLGPREVTDTATDIPEAGTDVRIPLGREGLHGLIATAIEHAYATKAADPDEWSSRQVSLALTNLEQAALWLVAAAATDRQAWPGALTDELLGI